ncbi:phytoene desaturase family protein [Solirubrobacter ginsenosidimutans]|uniref:Phytoene desaturase family protein n=1 Tax=Solirubrobacter ginsenosidimutans TaxID=490573 RepID=A0A9X3S734_9ACTN|nr:phytoene desaturase family protein [Solirubrobacter ginsenosidimutans]MDA0165691.1 phytoene desaturase family protein [Solirubrobacter ginsenosidimutans]
MRIAVIGAGLGGLALALRLQAAGCEVTVLEQRGVPGGRIGRLQDAGYTWDTGASLITMPWLLEETFAAGGIDLHSEVSLRRLDPLYRLRWASDPRTFHFADCAERLREEVAKFSSRDARRVGDFLEAAGRIYEHAVLDVGRRPCGDLRTLTPKLPALLRLDALMPLHRFVSHFFHHPRVREAFSFHSLFIGGDPFRVPAIYASLVYLQVLDGGWYADGGVLSLVEPIARRLDVRCGARVVAVETAGGRVRGVRLEDGERIAADVVVSNADVLRTDALLDRPASGRARRSTMSCFLLHLGLDRRFEELAHHTLLVGPDYRDFVQSVTQGRRPPRTFCAYVHAPARTQPSMAPPGADALSFLLPVANLRAGFDWEREADGLRAAFVADLERSFGLPGLDAAVTVEHRMTPPDFAHELGAVDGNAFSLEPTLLQSAAFRPPNRVAGVAGMYHVGAGTHPGAGIPGVLIGAAITSELVLADARRRGGGRA